MGRLAIILAAWLLFAPAVLQAAPPTAEEQALTKKYRAMLDNQHPVFGDVPIDRAKAVLHLGRNYYFLSAEEAKLVLTDGWGNPPSAVSDVLGMIFPSGTRFVDDTWGAVITYDPSGYVSDSDAKSADYSAIIKTSQDQEGEINEARIKEGFPAQHLVGWAQPPTYDPVSHAVIWAQNIQFGAEADHALNYDIRKLGRNGVLSVNIVSTMAKLPEIRSAAGELGKTSEFEKGSRYGDYIPDLDKKAEYGLAGLVAAGVGVAAAKKIGLLALFAVFAKKFFVVLLALLAGGANWARRLFRKKDSGRSGGDEPRDD